MPPTMRLRFALGPPLWGAKDSRIGLSDFCSISPQRQKTSIFGWCLKLDNTPSIASIIPDDAGDVVHAGDAKQWAKGEMQGNRSDWK